MVLVPTPKLVSIVVFLAIAVTMRVVVVVVSMMTSMLMIPPTFFQSEQNRVHDRCPQFVVCLPVAMLSGHLDRDNSNSLRVIRKGTSLYVPLSRSAM
jgi:uncharacterized membrane protein